MEGYSTLLVIRDTQSKIIMWYLSAHTLEWLNLKRLPNPVEDVRNLEFLCTTGGYVNRNNQVGNLTVYFN